MSASYFRSKDQSRVVEKPQHGMIGWNVERVVYVFIVSSELKLNGRVQMSDYVALKEKTKSERRRLFEISPHLLRQKIREKQQPARLLRRTHLGVGGYHLYQ